MALGIIGKPLAVQRKISLEITYRQLEIAQKFGGTTRQPVVFGLMLNCKLGNIFHALQRSQGLFITAEFDQVLGFQQKRHPLKNHQRPFHRQFQHFFGSIQRLLVFAEPVIGITDESKIDERLFFAAFFVSKHLARLLNGRSKVLLRHINIGKAQIYSVCL